MKITTKGHYGFHAMIELARHAGQGPVMIRHMAGAHGISEKYLEQIMRLLRQAGLVESSRGAKGGFWLAKPAAEITALQILEALEGEARSAFTDRLPREARPGQCAIKELWDQAEEEARSGWARKNLAELAERQGLLDRESGEKDYNI